MYIKLQAVLQLIPYTLSPSEVLLLITHILCVTFLSKLFQYLSAHAHSHARTHILMQSEHVLLFLHGMKALLITRLPSALYFLFSPGFFSFHPF